MLLERKGSALFLSTPNGRNWFWELYKLGLDPLEPEWSAHHFTSYDNPLIDPRELDSVKRNTPSRIWDEEYMAAFKDDAGQVFRGVQEVANVPAGVEPVPGRRYYFGVDWARDNDFTVIAVMDAEKRRLVYLDRFNQISWAVQRGRLKALFEKWQPAVIWAEQNSIGSVNIEALQAEGLPVRGFTTTAQSKAEIVEALALAIERADIELLNDPVLLGELMGFRLERLPGGAYRYGAPAGQHDDTVIALALAWYGVMRSPGGAGVVDWW
jgi:phage FluMu gp28-like protein